MQVTPLRIILLLAVLLIGAAAFALSGTDIRKLFTKDTFTTSIEVIAACAEQQSDIIPCARPEVLKLLEYKTGAEIVEAFAARLSPQRCHYITHVVGQELYRKTQSVEIAMENCNNTCGSACPHGILGEAFAQEIGLSNEDFKLGHLSADKLREIGQKLCSSRSGTCHGVGHALFQAYGNVTDASKICYELPMDARLLCFRGVYMEYNDVLADTSVWQAVSLTMPSLEELETMCDAPDGISEKRACYWYFPRMVGTVFKNQGEPSEKAMDFVKGICESRSNADTRVACGVGVGTYYTYLVITDQPAAKRACERFSKPADQAACTLGAVFLAAEYKRPDKVFEYCAALPEESVRAICYQTAFFTLDQMDAPASMDVCANDAACDWAAARFEKDPWEMIEERFAL